jgi:hypothetical protein
MIAKINIPLIVFLTAAIWGVLLLWDGVAVEVGWLQHYNKVTGIVVLLITTFELYLWRLPLLQGWAVKRPDLSGTWKAVFRSNWVDPDTGKGVPARISYVSITQTFSTMTFRLMSSESTSELLNAQLIPSMDGSYRLLGIYRNEPRLSVRQRSAIHNGALLLDVSSAPVSRMKGHYWTDRNTAGEIELTERVKEQHSDYESANAVLGPTTTRQVDDDSMTKL